VLVILVLTVEEVWVVSPFDTHYLAGNYK